MAPLLHMKQAHDLLPHLTRLGLAPTAEQLSQLAAYASLLREWNPKINLVSPTTIPDVELRHIVDSAQVVPHLPKNASSIVDVGAGAGLPGLIISILAPQHQVTLVERDQRKAAFLATAIHNLKLTSHCTVKAQDCTAISPQIADILTCRAFADVSKIIQLTHHILRPDGCWLLLKGKAYDAELKAYGNLSNMTVQTIPSITSTDGVILRLTPVPHGTHTPA